MHKRVIKGRTPDASVGPKKIIFKPPRIIPKETARLALGPNRRALRHSNPGQQYAGQLNDNNLMDENCEASSKGNPSTQLEIEELVTRMAHEMENKIRSEIKQAYDKGQSEGKTIGYGEAIGQIGRLEKLLNGIKEDIETRHNSDLEQLGSHLSRVASILAESVIGEAAVKYSGKILQHNLRRCLEVLKGSGKASIRINPLDYEFIKENTQILDNGDKRAYSFQFEPDPSIAPGGCYLETDNGAVDGRLESQIEMLKNHFQQQI